jgi:uncharacterized protein YegL
MTKENFVSINVIIDRSGSMAGLAADTIGSFNSFLSDQKSVPGEAAFTLCTFSNDYTLVHDFVTLASVPDLNPKSYRASGGTALLDAVGNTINSVGQKLAAMPEDERPSKVIFLIITDGEENSSRTFTKAQVKSLIEQQQSVYNWEFVFMGANIDAVSEGSSLGVASYNSVNYTASAGGTKILYKSVSSGMKSYRSRTNTSSKVNFFNQRTSVTGNTIPEVSPQVDVITTTTTTTTTGNK